MLQKIFAKKQYSDISEWYTVAEITEKFGVSKQYVYEYTSDHKLPKKREGKEVLISKYHWEQYKGLDLTENELYYTVPRFLPANPQPANNADEPPRVFGNLHCQKSEDARRAKYQRRKNETGRSNPGTT